MNRNPDPFLRTLTVGFAALLAFAVAFSTPSMAQIQKVSTDTLHNADSDHKTEVEPDTFAWGNTIVSTFHVARVPGSIGWGSGDVGWATSTDGGLTWKHGILPGLTKNYKNGPYGWAADPSVAYDVKHRTWMISTLPLAGQENSGLIGDVAVSLSSDGLNWGNPINIDNTHLDDKNWTTCDDNSKSKFFGHCYTEWDQAYGTGDILMSTSTNGGKTWTPGKPSADNAGGLGGEPVVQPNGTVIVPFVGGGIGAFRSTDGGKTWSNTVGVASMVSHGVAGGIRNPNLLGATVDGGGTAYVVWSDCRFRKNCSSNDVVMSTSTDGKTWTSPVRIPIDPVNSTVDHFIPGIGADPATSGKSAHLAVLYYYYPVSNCQNCQLYVGYTTSSDGGKTWTAGQQLAGPMNPNWLPVSDLGYMVADYVGVGYSNGNAFGVFASAKAPTNNGKTLHEDMYANKVPLKSLAGEPRYSSKADRPVPGFKSDHVVKFYYDDEGTREIPASRFVRVPANR